jgi:glycosyltransferase involved in cell wall biosynthesis
MPDVKKNYAHGSIVPKNLIQSPRMKNKPKVSIIIPTKNESEGLVSVIKSVQKYVDEIIIVDGRSNDGSSKIAKKFGAKFFLDHCLGKGDAVRLGIKKATGDILIIFDADGSPNPKDIPILVKTLIKENADLIITSRRTGGSFDFNLTLEGIIRTMGSDFMAYLVNKKFNTNYSDILYNFRVIKTSSVKKLKLKSNGFDIEQEVLVSALIHKMKVIEIPSREAKRKWGESKLSTLSGINLLGKLITQLVSKE